MPTTNPSEYTPQFWWNVIQGGTTAVLAFFGYLITRRNADIAARNLSVTELKSRLEQFDKRYAVFAGVQMFFMVLDRDNDLKEEDLRAFHIAVGDAPFLFYEEVTLLLGQISKEAAELKSLTAVYDDLPVGPERSAAVQARYDHFKKLRARKDGVIPLFLPYLDARPTARPVSWDQIESDVRSQQKIKDSKGKAGM